MDFRTYAEKEAADLVARLAKASSDAVAATEKRLAEEAKRAAAEAQNAAEAQRAEALKVAEALKTELQGAVKQKMAVAASLKEAQAQVETVRAELKTATERAEVANRHLADARKANEKLEAARNELAAAYEKLTNQHASAEAEVKKSRDAVAAARAEVDAAMKRVEKVSAEKAGLEEAAEVAQSQSQASEAKLAAVTDLFKQSGARVKVLERAQQEFERKIASLEARLKEAPPAPAAGSGISPVPIFDDLLSGFQALGSATTIGDVLTTLVEQLAAQFPRVALFRVKKSHLQGEHQIGFDLKTDIGKVVMPLGMDSLLARAASSGQVERLSAEELAESNATPFNGSPMNALALPIMAGGEPLAIVYADDSGARPAESTDAIDLTVRFAEAMQQHAAALLTRLTNELKTLNELQAYAGSLLRELEQMHAADVQSGLGEKELQERLKGNLEYARSIYNSRIALEGADAAGLLEEELTSMIETQRGTPFGRDLAVAAGRPDLAKRSKAEAS